MSNLELQEEEREVLLSIYEGDVAFNQLSPTTYQYKFGEDNDVKSFLLEISWGPEYPTEKPEINLNTFYNRHLIPVVKDKIIAHLDKEVEQWLGCAMTYTLIQSVAENCSDLLVDQPNDISEIEDKTEKLNITTMNKVNEETTKKPKPEQLTKAQKRRQWNQVDEKGEKPRGWNWVDVVKHLSQTSSAKEQES